MAALVLFAGCKKDKETTGTTLTASIEQQQGNGSKTSLDPSNGAIKWTTGDKIVVNNGTTNGTFTLTAGAGTTTGTFTYNGEYTYGGNNIAVYPETATISGNTVTVTLPAEQTYAAARNGSTPMLGTFADPNNLTFTSLCGVLGISLKAASADIDITAVEVVSKLDEKLNGTFTCTTADPQLTVAAGDADTKKVRLNCTATLTTTEAQNFYFAMPVGALANGFTLNVYGDGADPIFSTNTNNDITIVLNQVNQMPEVPVTVFDALTTPLTFEAKDAGSTVSINVDGLEYSTNGVSWSTYTSGEEITLSAVGDKVSFKAANTNSNMNYQSFLISGGCWVYGNVMSLLDNNYSSATSVGEYALAGLFAYTPIDIPSDKELLLSATTLAEYCYYDMFYYCNSLTKAPVLSATTLAEYCYYYMFAECTKLTTAPVLPATTLAKYCYYAMFDGCTKLTMAPALPATTLAEDCYSGMFEDCTSLTTAPALPATTLAASCYNEMFEYCISLTTVPDLPATTLAASCCYDMFRGCTSLTTAPALPATTLANNCYKSMFYGCTSLTKAPVLPATTLVEGCYNTMFCGCTSLDSITCLATSGINENSTDDWLCEVAPSGVFTADMAGIWPTNNPSGIPSGWTRKNLDVSTHEYVDLGLPSGLLWATCNVGAVTPEGYGIHFAWGETTPKAYYDGSTYQYYIGNKLTKYCYNASYGYNGYTDDLTTLQPEDDAATANWGNDWRMPTKEDFVELYNNTTHIWTTQNSVNGCLFTALNGNSLFLPAAGYGNGYSVSGEGSSGLYWSSSLYTEQVAPVGAWHLFFNSGSCSTYCGDRDYGLSVRPVRNAK